MTNLIRRCLGVAFFSSVAFAAAAAQSFSVAPNGQALQRPTFSYDAPTPAKLGGIVSRVTVGAACDCTTTIVSGGLTYCAVSGKPMQFAVCSPVSPPPPPPPLLAWSKIAFEGSSFTLTSAQVVRYGSGTTWVEQAMPVGSASCSNASFGGDPLPNVGKQCEAKIVAIDPPPPNLPPTPTDHHAGVHVADTSTWPIFQPGIDSLLLSEPGPLPTPHAPDDWESSGDFRTVCLPVKMGYDDPIVYPGKPGMAHHHTFFGLAEIDAFTTNLDADGKPGGNIRKAGNHSTCRGGTVNLSSYWVPSMIDTRTGAPISPRTLLVYYKTGVWPYMNAGQQLANLPHGLRMIAGDASNTAPNPAAVGFNCITTATGNSRPGTKTADGSIPTNCVAGEDDLWTSVQFPQCWDGVNLDSPNHKSHMAYPISFWTGDPQRQYRCPTTHPVPIVQITMKPIYSVPADGSMKYWRAASDAYTGPAGFSYHADWMNGWDPVFSDRWSEKCSRARVNCGSAQDGEGRNMLEFQGN